MNYDEGLILFMRYRPRDIFKCTNAYNVKFVYDIKAFFYTNV